MSAQGKKRGPKARLWHNPKVGREFAMAVWKRSFNGKSCLSDAWVISIVLERPEFADLRRYIKKGKRRPYSYLEKQLVNCRKFFPGLDGADLSWFRPLSTPTSIAHSSRKRQMT